MNAYKFTQANGETNGGFRWPLPTADGPGEWVEVGKRAKRALTSTDLCSGRVLHATDAAHLLDQLSAAARGEVGLVPAIGIYEQEMRDYVYPFMQMTMDHDQQFGGGALKGRDQRDDAPAG